ncbi:ATP-binding cassette domain-containing protein [Virgibacillus halodenitrificans]|uniref:ABC transporter ATP-binding protein n=1 Tax=Virgibacillus halodenitrificans TaxID=1482 RepID=UPI00136C699B|nr:ABC transporter ATP-binding protein [Virgibacillus halodenitrificans]MYL45352.1 ATP-binding cassette domain-containing protein [Virgibacillus halodenitrificans]MYL57527.1 ATP-binding cassette domain-containing protein [Virgibacillus halodenitrificans]
MIEFKKVNKTYSDGTEAVKDFSLHIEEGEIVTLIGPSGCGKTTTMKMVNRLIEPTLGEIYINNKNIKKYNIHELRWNIGYVLQQIALFPHMTIGENISVVPEMKKWKRKDVDKRAEELLQMVGLDPSTFKKRMPQELSGGQQQRIGVIRALAADPDIILMDEPFSALDPISREQLQDDIRNLQKEIKKTILFVTHDIDEAMALGDKVCLMKGGEIVQVDTPQNLILHPATDFVKDFIGERKSPWQTAVDVIAVPDDEVVLSQELYKKGEYDEQKIYFVIEENGTYLGTLQYGKLIDGETLDNNIPLYKATEALQSKEKLPVLNGNKLVGVLSYKLIVNYLKSKTKVENGVIHS